MGHTRAFLGLNILVYGETPLLPMQIEQGIAQATPEHELLVDSFESYDDAYDFTNLKKNVGVAFILENSGELDPAQVLRELSNASKELGYFVIGVLVHEGSPSIKGYKTLSDNRQFIRYIPSSSLTEPGICKSLMNELWETYSALYEAELIPEPLKTSIYSVVEKEFDHDSRAFYERTVRLISTNLNITWLESIAVQWAPVEMIVKEKCPEVIQPHQIFEDTIALARPWEMFAPKIFNYESLRVSATSNRVLPSRIVGTAIILNEMRKLGTLQKELQILGTQTKPTSPALLRHIVQYREKLIEFADSVSRSLDENRKVAA